MPPHHNPTVVASVQAICFGARLLVWWRRDCRGQLGTFELPGAVIASGKTLHAIHRRRGLPYSSVKQRAARLNEGEMDVTFLARRVRKRKSAKQN